MQNEFKQLAAELSRDFPGSKPKLTLFPSGAAMLDVTVGDETYVLEYHLDVGLGINRMSAAVFGWEGYENAINGIDDARKFFHAALSEKSNSAVNQEVAARAKSDEHRKSGAA